MNHIRRLSSAIGRRGGEVSAMSSPDCCHVANLPHWLMAPVSMAIGTPQPSPLITAADKVVHGQLSSGKPIRRFSSTSPVGDLPAESQPFVQSSAVAATLDASGWLSSTQVVRARPCGSIGIRKAILIRDCAVGVDLCPRVVDHESAPLFYGGSCRRTQHRACCVRAIRRHVDGGAKSILVCHLVDTVIFQDASLRRAGEREVAPFNGVRPSVPLVHVPTAAPGDRSSRVTELLCVPSVVRYSRKAVVGTLG